MLTREQRDKWAEDEAVLMLAARAYNPVGWAWFDRAEDDHPAKPIFREREMKQISAAVRALPVSDDGESP